MGTALTDDGGETASAAQPVESSGVDDSRHPVPSVAFEPVQEFYLGYVYRHLRAEFPKLPSYQCCAAPLAALFDSLKGNCDGIALAVCDNKRIRATRSSKGVPSEVRLRWAGFTALSCTPLSIRKANCSDSS
jgi:hypothetical protein